MQAQHAISTRAVTTIAAVKNVSVLLGTRIERALALLDEGQSRQYILEDCQTVLGVANCNLQIAQGEISVLMGLSGSGKSTLLRCFNGLNRASRGEVLIYGENGEVVDVNHCSAQVLRTLRMHRVAMVFQQFALLPWRTVAENVGLGLELSQVPKRERNRIVEEKLELVGLQKWANHYAHQLSGGMQQRVGLARAFATNADILLMDEPFSALDPLIREYLQQELLQLQTQLKKTIVFVSHDLDEAMKLANHISIMEEGRIVQYGKPEEIVLNPQSDYVRNFVAHMNPSKVLRAATLMLPVERLVVRDNWLELDINKALRVRLDQTGKIVGVRMGEATLKLVPSDAIPQVSKIDTPESITFICSCDLDTKLEQVISLRHRSRLPVLLCKDEKLVGVITDNAIFQGLVLTQKNQS